MLVKKEALISLMFSLYLNWIENSWIEFENMIPNDHPIILVTKLIRVEFYRKHFDRFFFTKIGYGMFITKKCFYRNWFYYPIILSNFRIDFFWDKVNSMFHHFLISLLEGTKGFVPLKIVNNILWSKLAFLYPTFVCRSFMTFFLRMLWVFCFLYARSSSLYWLQVCLFKKFTYLSS
jgi:hypothetical protein